MQKIFFIGDLHFGHANVIKFDNRPFESIEEMDEELIKRWNNKVKPGDLVYILGDFIWKARNNDAPTLLKQLNGQKILIKGNHDRFLHNAKAKKLLAGIKEYDLIHVTLEDGTSTSVFLSHYYTPLYIGHHYGGVHLHAHSHITAEANEERLMTQQLKDKGFNVRIFNVGCMYWNYEPVTLDEILKTEK